MDLIEEFDEWYRTYEYWYCVRKPKNLLKSVVKLGEEVGEVCEAIAAFTGSATKQAKLETKGQTPREGLLEELGDVLVVVHNIATLANISHEELYSAAQSKAERRIEKINKGLELCRMQKKN